MDWWRKLTYLLWRDRRTAELEEEIRLHVALRTRQFEAAGLSGSEAHEQARRQFGDELALVELSRSQWGVGWLDGLNHDVRFALRGLRRTPWLTAVVVLTLMLVVGANASVFGVLHGLFLQRLPLLEAHELRAVQPMDRGQLDDINYAEYLELKAAPGVPGIEAYRFDAVSATTGGRREDVHVDLVSGGFFDLLRAEPAVGRLLSEIDDATAAPVVVISSSFRARFFESDRGALGSTVHLDGRPVTVVGVLPASFEGIHFARTLNVALPLRSARALGFPSGPLTAHFLITRVERGRTNSARAALQAAYTGCCLTDSRPDPSGVVAADAGRPRAEPEDAPTGVHQYTSVDKKPHVQLTDASHGLRWSVDYRATYGPVLLAIAAGLLMLLMIGCANIGTLLLARAVAREREFAVLLSLGAAKARVLRLLLFESAFIAVLGGALGLLAAAAGTGILLHTLPPSLSKLTNAVEWRMSPAVLGFTLAAAIACTFLFGVWPARHASRTNVLDMIKGTRASGQRGSRFSADRTLVATQMVLALVLVCMAALFAATVRNLTRFDAGFNSELIVARIDAENSRYARLTLSRLSADLLRSLDQSPGMRTAAVALDAPMQMDFMTQSFYRIPGTPHDQRIIGRFNAVSSDYFAVAGIRIERGRGFERADGAGAELVAVISETFARRYFGQRDPVGSIIVSERKKIPIEIRIVGVVEETRYDDPREPTTPMWFVSLEQADTFARAPSSVAVLARPAGDGATELSKLIAAVRSLDPDLRVRKANTMGGMLKEALLRERAAAQLSRVFGVVALLLATLGAYGLLSHRTARRTREIGVRIALGARPVDALGLVLQQTLTLVAVSVAAGLPLAALAAFALRTQLFGIEAADPRVLVVSGIVLLGSALLASLIPAWRAARVNPVEALRSE